MTFLKKILLVDDEPRVTAMVRHALELTGRYVIKEAHNSQLAFNAARWFQPDLILLDLLMSRTGNGVVARQLREDSALKDTPVLFLSVAGASADGVVSSGILGGYTFFANAVGIDDFVRCVAEILKPAAKRA